MALPLALGIHDAKIVLGVLIEIFRRDAIAARLGFAGQGNIALEDLIGVAANFYVRTVAVESLHAVGQARPIMMWTATTAAALTTASAAVTAA